MLTDKFFAIAEIGHETTLWLLILLSILSVAFILERFISLKQEKKKFTENERTAYRYFKK